MDARKRYKRLWIATRRSSSTDSHAQLDSTEASEDTDDDNAKRTKFDRAATEHAAPSASANKLRPADVHLHDDPLSTNPASSRDNNGEIADIKCCSSGN